jgi:hypothetical protein
MEGVVFLLEYLQYAIKRKPRLWCVFVLGIVGSALVAMSFWLLTGEKNWRDWEWFWKGIGCIAIFGMGLALSLISLAELISWIGHTYFPDKMGVNPPAAAPPDLGFNKLSSGLRETPPGSRIQVVEASPQRLVLCILGRGSRETKGLWAMAILSVLGTIGFVWAVVLMARGSPGELLLKISMVVWLVGVPLMCLSVKAKFERTLLLLERDRLVIQRVLLGFTRKSTVELTADSRAELIQAGGPEVTTDGVKMAGRNQTVTFGNLLSTAQNRWVVEAINEILAPSTAGYPDDSVAR